MAATNIRRPRPPEGVDYRVNPLPEHQRSFTGFLKAIRDVAEEHQATSLEAAGQAALARQVLKQHYYEPKREAEIRKAAMQEGSGQLGGYLVPLDYTLQLYRTIAEENFIWPRADVVPMNRREMLAPRPYVEVADSPTTGQTPFFPGVSFKWGSEQAPTEIAEPKYAQVSLTAWDLLGYCTISNQMLWDTGDEGEDRLLDLFGRAAGWYTEYAFFQGTGTAQQMPLGILNTEATLQVTRAVHNQIANSDLALMAGGMIPSGWKHGIWAGNPTVWQQIGKATGFTVNRPLSDDFEGAAGCLFGRPFFITDKLPALGSIGDLVFFDPKLYAIGSRQEVAIDVSPHTLFATNQTVYRIWIRCDGRPYLSDTIILADGSSTEVSAYVVMTAT